MLLVIFHCFLAWDFLLSRSKYFYFLDDRTYSFGTFYFDHCENVTFDEVVDSAGNSPRKIEREQNQIHMVSVVKYICLYFPSGFGDHKTPFIFKIAGLLIFWLFTLVSKALSTRIFGFNFKHFQHAYFFQCLIHTSSKALVIAKKVLERIIYRQTLESTLYFTQTRNLHNKRVVH